MRKLFFFLLLFGLGLVALLLIERSMRPEHTPPAPVEVRQPPPAEVVPPESTDEPQAGSEQAPPGYVSGKTEFTGFDDATGARQYHFDATVEHLGQGRYVARQVQTEMYDSTGRVLLQHVESQEARLRIELDRETKLRVGDGGRVDLSQVVIRREAGSPFAPLEVRSPTFQGSLDTRVLTSGEGDLVTIEGRGLRGNGRGFTLREAADQLAFERGGELVLDLEDGAHVRLATRGAGPIAFARTLDRSGEERYELQAGEGSSIEYWDVGVALDQEPIFVVEALRIELRGKRGETGYILQSADGIGELVVRRSADEFRGERALARFDAQGRPTRLDIQGTPQGRLWLETGGGQSTALETRGEGDLTVLLGTRGQFHQDGPAELTIPDYDFRLRAAGSLAGTLHPETRKAEFEAEREVRLTQAEGTPLERVLTTDRLSGHLTATEVGPLHAEAQGRTHMLAADAAGDPVDLEAEGLLVLEAEGKSWSVPLAEKVRLVREGPQALQASALRLTELDSARRTFTLEGQVSYQSRLGRGRAARARATGPDHIELLGAPGDLAHFDVGPSIPGAPETGSFDALKVDLYPDRLEAREDSITVVHALDRDYRLASGYVQLTVEPRDPERDARPFTLQCERVSEARFSQPGQETTCTADELLVVGLLRDRDLTQAPVEASRVTASGRVEVHHLGELELHGSGDQFTLDGQGVGRLDAHDQKRVTAWGRLAESALPYRMTATYVRFDPRTLDAGEPRLYIDATLLPVFPRGELVEGFTEARGDALRVELENIWLLGHASVEGLDRSGSKLLLEASSIRLQGELRQARELDQGHWIHGIEATGGFHAVYEDQGSATGESFSFTRERTVLLGQPAVLSMGGLNLSSELIDVDLVRFLITTKAGSFWSEDAGQPWRLDFASMQPITRGDETLFVLREPRSAQADLTTRAAWAVAWVDLAAWERRSNEALWGKPAEGEVEALPEPRMPKRDLYENPFRRIASERFGQYIEKLYLEGDVEILEGNERSARADALLVDLREHTGYMQNAEVLTLVDVFGDRERMRTRAGTLRMAADGSLHAKQATMTSCEFVEPHYHMLTSDLTLDPRPGGGWRISAHGNRLRFANGLQLPLPPIGGLVLDDDGDIKGFETSAGDVWGVEAVGVGDSPRFGTSVTTGVRTEAGKIGLGVGKLAGFKGATVRGRWKYDGSFLGSRGVLLGIGLELRERDPKKDAEEQAWLNIYASGLSDSGRDRGYVRVDDEDRGSYRGWYRARGRYPLSHDEWIDVALTHQTDPAVQSEFFERLYTRFEQRDNELHYRRAEGADYYQASVKARIDDYRSEVEELPSAGYFHGATPITRIGKYELLYSGALDVAYLRRRQGTVGDPTDAQLVDGYTEYSEVLFQDGLGDREVVRLDSQHSLEMPFSLGFQGLRAKPFLETQLTAWDKGVDPDQDPGRAGLFGGMELATTYWRRTSGSLTSLTPSVRVSEELALEESGSGPVRFDTLDDPIDGNTVELGLRTRWKNSKKPRSLDLDLRSVHRTDRASGLEDQHMLAALGELRTQLFGVPLAMRQDYRYDTEEKEPLYWRSAVGIQPREDLQLEVAYTLGPKIDDPIVAEAFNLDVGDPRYEAASGRARYRFSPKWEFEFAETYSLINGGRLDNDFILRRFGHDSLIEFNVSQRTGEGAAFGIGFRPLLGWRPRRLGLLE